MSQLHSSFIVAESQLCFESNECDIYYHKALNVIETKWKGPFMRSEQLHQIFNTIIDVIKEKQLQSLIFDARKMKAISNDDQSWIIYDWCPRAIEAGFKKQALIIAPDTFSELSLKNIARHYDPAEIHTGYFMGSQEV